MMIHIIKQYTWIILKGTVLNNILINMNMDTMLAILIPVYVIYPYFWTKFSTGNLFCWYVDFNSIMCILFLKTKNKQIVYIFTIDYHMCFIINEKYTRKFIFVEKVNTGNIKNIFHSYIGF